MRLLKNKFLAEDLRIVEGPVKQKGQLLLFDSEEYASYVELRVLQVPDEEQDIKVGDIVKVKKGVGHKVDVEGESLTIFHKDDVIYFVEADEA